MIIGGIHDCDEEIRKRDSAAPRVLESSQAEPL
jgi:hypothetical protein